jgi:hypothetical protein
VPRNSVIFDVRKLRISLTPRGHLYSVFTNFVHLSFICLSYSAHIHVRVCVNVHHRVCVLVWGVPPVTKVLHIHSSPHIHVSHNPGSATYFVFHFSCSCLRSPLSFPSIYPPVYSLSTSVSPPLPLFFRLSLYISPPLSLYLCIFPSLFFPLSIYFCLIPSLSPRQQNNSIMFI